MPANRCTNCISNGVKCTHFGLTAVCLLSISQVHAQTSIRTSGRPKGWSPRFLSTDVPVLMINRYAESLEIRLEKMEQLLKKVGPLISYFPSCKLMQLSLRPELILISKMIPLCQVPQQTLVTFCLGMTISLIRALAWFKLAGTETKLAQPKSLENPGSSSIGVFFLSDTDTMIVHYILFRLRCSILRATLRRPRNDYE